MYRSSACVIEAAEKVYFVSECFTGNVYDLHRFYACMLKDCLHGYDYLKLCRYAHDLQIYVCRRFMCGFKALAVHMRRRCACISGNEINAVYDSEITRVCTSIVEDAVLIC